jgi:mono/diheme cytochrome c family protein
VLAAGAALALLAQVATPARAASKGEARKAESKANPRAGREIYEKLCGVCHGPEGRGNGQALRGMPVKPKDFADAAAMRELTDQYLFDAIQKGGVGVKKSPMMPPFGDQLKEPQIWDLVAYIRSLAPPLGGQPPSRR